MTSKNHSKRAQFGSRLGLVATTVGSAVGLGNIWRFPYEAGTHGGGAFLLCYIFFVILIGIPVICAEFAMGRASRSGVVGAYIKLGGNPRRWAWPGYAAILAAAMIIAFYSVVSSWTMEYMVHSTVHIFNPQPTGNIHNDFAQFIAGPKAVIWVAVFMLINGGVLLGGVQKGLERVSSILMPVLFLILLVFCVNSLLMPGASEGLSFLFHPDFSKLTPSVILGAMGQAFFSMSLGMGCLITYASYFKDDTPLLRTAGEIALLDTLVAILAGVIIFPAVFSFGMSPAEGPTLVFEVLPNIFSRIPGGDVWSALFFLLLFVASLTSLMSVSEIVVSFLGDEFRMKRRTAVLWITGIGIILGSLCSLSFGPLKSWNLFNIFDYISSNILLPLGGMATSYFVGWTLKKKFIAAQINPNGKIPAWLLSGIIISLRYIAPACILAVFIAGLF